MVADKDKTRRAVIDAQVYGKINLPYNFSVMVKANGNNSTSNRQTYNNPNIGDGAANNGSFVQPCIPVCYLYSPGVADMESEPMEAQRRCYVRYENYSWREKLTRGMNTNMAVSGNW